MFEKLKRIFEEPKPDPEIEWLSTIVVLLLEELKLEETYDAFGDVTLTKVKATRKKRAPKKSTPTPQEQDWP